jgi:hypothetical protein
LADAVSTLASQIGGVNLLNRVNSLLVGTPALGFFVFDQPTGADIANYLVAAIAASLIKLR